MPTKSEAKDWGREKIKGLFVGMIQPYDENMNVDEEGYKHNVRKVIDEKTVHGIGIGLDEANSLSLEERKVIFRAAAEAAQGRIITRAYTGCSSVEDTIELTNYAAEVGIDCTMINVPYELAKNQQMIYDFFRRVDEKTDIGIVVWNTPESGHVMSPELLLKVGGLQSVCAVKDVAGSISEWHRAVELGVPNPAWAGEQDWLVSYRFLGNKWNSPSIVLMLQTKGRTPIMDYTNLMFQGKWEEASKIYFSLDHARKVWRKAYASMFNPGPGELPFHPYGYTKYWESLLGFKAGPARAPLPNPTPEEKAWFANEVAKLGLIKAVPAELEPLLQTAH